MEFVDVIQHPNLYLRLIILVLKASNPEKADQFNFAYSKALAVFQVDFLDRKGKGYNQKIQSVTRHFANFLIKAGKPKHGIAPIAKALRVLRASNEQVSTLNTQYAMLCLKARCF